METVFIQIPAGLYAEIYALHKEGTADAISNCLNQLIVSRRSERSRPGKDKPQFRQRPKGAKTGKVWEVADGLAETGVSDRESVVKACIEQENINLNTANTQYSHWRKARGVMAYQDLTLMENDREDTRLTDAELVDEWHDKYPNALYLDKQNRVGEYTYVKDIRRCFNQGIQGHGQRDAHGEIVGRPDTPSQPYDEAREKYWYSPQWKRACQQDRDN